MNLRSVLISLLLFFTVSSGSAQPEKIKRTEIDVAGFRDSAHHWYDINDEVPKLIKPVEAQKKYSKDQIEKIADNIILYQRSNGGWPKNYDMQAILTEEQRGILLATKSDFSLTTFDNGATHSQIEYLAQAYMLTKQDRFKISCQQGIAFVLSAQYPNGGFPQFFPDSSGYRKHITFNDGAMGGVMGVLGRIVRAEPRYAFVDSQQRSMVRSAYDKGLDCIVKCQIRVHDTLTAWCQQHDRQSFLPQNARTFEPKAICSMESAELVQFLMEIDHPSDEVKQAVRSAVDWFRRSAIKGIRVEGKKMKKIDFMFHSSDEDRVVVQDSSAPQIWSRMYEIDTNRPLFCRRDRTIVYSLAEVELERRTGYRWYGYDPQQVLDGYEAWRLKCDPRREIQK